jgi:heme/copper-type cytochrome/quinol oxidase subunit 2
MMMMMIIIIIIIMTIIFVVRWGSINEKQSSREGKKMSVKISAGVKTLGMQQHCC